LHGSNQQGSRNLPDLIDGTTGVSGATGMSFVHEVVAVRIVRLNEWVSIGNFLSFCCHFFATQITGGAKELMVVL